MNQVVQRQNTMGPNWINALLGIWVIISPFVLGFNRNESAMWNNVATGAAVLLVAIGRTGTSVAASILNLLLGGWLIASPFVLGFSRQVIFWNNRILGIVILISALVALGQRRHAVSAPQPPPPAR